MSKEKEFKIRQIEGMIKPMQEIKEYLKLDICIEHEGYQIAQVIFDEGYRKFPIEKLEERLGNLKRNWSERKNKDQIEKSLAGIIVTVLQGVLDYIQALKGDNEEG